jgi:hypothetical protein
VDAEREALILPDVVAKGCRRAGLGHMCRPGALLAAAALVAQKLFGVRSPIGAPWVH